MIVLSSSRLLLPCLLMSLLAGCATRMAYEKQLNAYVGKSIDTIIGKGNIPTREYTMATGNKIYCFETRSLMSVPIMTTPTQSISTVSGNNVYTTTYGGTITGGGTVTLWCNTCFVTNKARTIMRYNLQGNSCVADSN